jgi:hypothetical protein
VSIIVLKLVATPLLILAASLTGRRWGETVSGWFVGLPLTSAPVCFFLAVEQGPAFAANAAVGCLAGVIAEAAFCLAYGFSARHRFWLCSLLAGSAAFALAGIILAAAGLSFPVFVPLVAAVLGSTLALLPRYRAAMPARRSPPAWDIPARMAVATVLVFTLTALGPVLGPRPSGILATFPVFAAVLTCFAHRASGAAAATGVLRGLMIGAFGFTGFFAVLAPLLHHLGLAASFSTATLVALSIQGLTFAALRRCAPAGSTLGPVNG